MAWRIALLLSTMAAGFWLAFISETVPPRNTDDACKIFSQHPDWYADANRAAERWEVPVPVLLAIIHRESHFRANAKPGRKRILWIFPGPRLSSALGYSQALDATWDRYMKEARNPSARRDRFRDAVDFVGWYVHDSWRQVGIAKHDAYHHYLAYYFGQAGYKRDAMNEQPWVERKAVRVQHQADLYKAQMDKCRTELENLKPWWWPF